MSARALLFLPGRADNVCKAIHFLVARAAAGGFGLHVSDLTYADSADAEPHSATSAEPERLVALRRLLILDTPPELAFDRVTALAARLFAMPVSLVSFLDSDRQWFKSHYGTDLCETPLSMSFCVHTVSANQTMVVPDAASDPRFADNPLVTDDPRVRFYAGVPLRTPAGEALGTLCVLDTKPRFFGPAARQMLADLAATVERELELRRTALELRETARVAEASREKYRSLFHANPQPTWVYDTRTLRFLAVNEAAVTRYGYSEAEFLSMTLCDIRAPQDVPALLDDITGVCGHRYNVGPWRHLSKMGEPFWVEISSHPLEFEGLDARLIVVNDVTARTQAEDARRRAEANYRSIFENAIEGIFQTTLAGAFLSANPASARMLGYDSPEDLIARVRNLARDLYVNASDRDAFVREMGAHGIVQDFEAQFYRANGTTVWVSLCARAVRDEHGAVLFYEGTAQEITERKTLEAEREAQLADALERADRDPLTGLWNHRAFHKRLEEEAGRARRDGTALGIAVLDINDFKFFNDAYGHAVGDEALRQVASVLQFCCRPDDTLARFGGDEFAMLLPNPGGLSDTKARLLACTDAIACRPPGSDSAVPLRLSIGVAVLPDDGPERLDALAEANARLRRAQSGEADEQADLLRATLTQRREGFSMLDALVTAVDNKDRYTRRHSEDVMHYAVAIARKLGLDERAQHVVEVAALLHDVGKIGVPDRVLRKPGRLTESEFEAVKQHPMMGAIIVGAVPGFEETLDAVRHHHERWDGEGYPFGLRGAEIPQIARLMAVADAYSAMTTDRPYRKGMDEARALSILQSGAGTQWDAECVRAFMDTRQNRHVPAA